MKNKKGLASPGFPSLISETVGPRRSRFFISACFGALAMVTVFAQTPQSPEPSTNSSLASLTPDSNLQAVANGQQGKPQNLDSASAERKRQLTEESTALLKLASDLKADVDRTNKDILSLFVIHDANEIERLAHSVKESAKNSTGKN